MVNFGYPYNDIVICKDSTDYLQYYYIIQLVLYLAKVVPAPPPPPPPKRYKKRQNEKRYWSVAYLLKHILGVEFFLRKLLIFYGSDLKYVIGG